MSGFPLSYLRMKGIQTVNDESENVGFCCPFHEDTVASASFHQEKEIWGCFACNVGGNLVDFEAKLRGCSVEVAEQFIKLYKGQTPTVQSEEVEARHADLLARPDLVERLGRERRITPEQVKKYKLGWETQSHGRLWIPIYFGEFIINVKRWDVFYRDAEGDEFKKRKCSKMLPYKKGYSMELLFPYEQLTSKTLMITEGEGDCLLALSLGIPAITAGSAQSNLENHAGRLAGKTAYLCYDVDEAGRNGCALNAGRLNRAGIKLKVIDLTKLGAREGQDLTDIVLASNLGYGDFDSLIDSTPWFGAEPGQEAPATTPEQTPEEIEFGNYVQERYQHKVVSISSILAGQDEICKRIPYQMKIRCLKTRTAKCHHCPVNEEKSGQCVNLNVNTEKAISFYYGNKKAEHELVRDYFGAVCDGFDYTLLSEQNLTKVMLVPNTSFKVNSKVSLVYGFTSDVYCEFNHSYQVVATVITNPRNNEVNLLIKSFEESTSFAVRITEQFVSDHKIFQIEVMEP